MRLNEIQPIKPIKPKNPDQQRVANMQASAKRAQDAVKAERARQKVASGQQALAASQAAGTTVS